MSPNHFVQDFYQPDSSNDSFKWWSEIFYGYITLASFFIIYVISAKGCVSCKKQHQLTPLQ
jgi:hypothetical protein